MVMTLAQTFNGAEATAIKDAAEEEKGIIAVRRTTHQYVKVKSKVILQSEQELIDSINREIASRGGKAVKSVPEHMKQVPILEVPVLEVSPETGMGVVVQQPRYVFRDPKFDGVPDTASLVTLSGVNLDATLYERKEVFQKSR